MSEDTPTKPLFTPCARCAEDGRLEECLMVWDGAGPYHDRPVCGECHLELMDEQSDHQLP